MGVLSVLESVEEEEAATLEDARKVIADLKERNRKNGRLLRVWKKKLREQNLNILHLKKEKDQQMKSIQCQLLLLESQLQKRQGEIKAISEAKSRIIEEQQSLILSLAASLSKHGGENDLQRLVSSLSLSAADSKKGKERSLDEAQGSLFSASKSDAESLNDSDSAIMLEDNYDSLVSVCSAKGEVRIARSVSDAVKCASRNMSNFEQGSELCKDNASSLSNSSSCSAEDSDESSGSNPSTSSSDIIKSVYNSPENESLSRSSGKKEHGLSKDSSTKKYEIEVALSDGDSDDMEEDANVSYLQGSLIDKRHLLGSYEKLTALVSDKRPPEDLNQVTYNRVMSNHRSVTKPKDVKYKRINKAKSRSLEELRGKLKQWDAKHCIATIDLRHSYA